MKLSRTLFLPARRRRGGWALLVVMVLSACCLMALASVVMWSNVNTEHTARNNEYFATAYAAEAATEKVLAQMSQQYENYGFALVSQNMSNYTTNIPNSSDGAYWTNFQFSYGSGHSNQLFVTNTGTSTNVVATYPYAGLTQTIYSYNIIASAQNRTTIYKIPSTVGQQVNLTTIPLFQFAVFYQGDMEFAPGASMSVSGLVHGNSDIYLDPCAGAAGLTFSNCVSACGNIYTNQSPLDPSVREPYSWTAFDSYEMTNVNPLNLPAGTNTTGSSSNSSQNIYAILEPPQAGQGPTTATGSCLLYNKADMIVMISNNNTILVTSGAGVNSQATVISNNQWSSWLTTNGSFYDMRDSLNVNPVLLNISNLVSWSATNTVLRPVLSSYRSSSFADVQSIYVADLRSTSNAVITTNGSGTNRTYSTNWTIVSQPGIVLSNGAYLPPQGLSVATPDPLYVIGNWNVMLTNDGTSDAASSSTSYSKPSAFYADAITVLSSAWNPANSTLDKNYRPAVTDTVNAAFLCGDVPSNGTYYSGGVQNLPRFLEDWEYVNFYYNGSLVCGFTSQIATAPFDNGPDYYFPPNRIWGFDTNMYNPSTLPPMTPQVMSVVRNQWALLAPGATTMTNVSYY